MRVLQIGFGYKVGGIQNCLLNFYKNIDKENFQFDFINMTGHKFYYEEDIKKIGGAIYDIPNELSNPIKCYNKLKEIIKDNKYDIVHINKNSLACMVAIKAVKDSGVKVKIIHSHSTKSNAGRVANIIHNINKRFIHKYCDYFFACSQEAGRWMYTDKIIKSNKFYILNNAIDLNKFTFNKEKRNEIRQKLNIKENELIIGHVGRFVPIKNHKFIIDLFNNISNKNSNTKLLLVGDGVLLEEMKSYVQTLGLMEKVIFLGNRRDTYDLYQAMDIFVLPSFHEGLPIVGVEAQASGLPCVFSTSVTKEAKILDESCFVSLDETIDIWSDKILNMLKNTKRNTQLDKITKSGFDIKHETKRLENMYNVFVESEKQ